MSGLPFRPRPIDVNKQIPIIRQDLEEVDADDIEFAESRLPQMPTGMEAEEEKESHIQLAINNLNRSQIEIPTPNIKDVAGYDDEKIPPWNRPQTYVRFKDPTNEDIEELVEYDLEPEDYEFLDRIADIIGPKKLTENKLEYIMDRLEKESARLDKVPIFKEVENLPAKLSKWPKIGTEIYEQVFNHWLERRKSIKTPLNTRYLKPPDPEDMDPYKAFRPRLEEKLKKKSRKNDLTSYLKMKELRQEMERARTVLEMLKKREKLKKDYMYFLELVFDAKLADIRENGDLPFERKPKKSKKRKVATYEDDEFGDTYGISDGIFGMPPESPVEDSISEDEEFQQLLVKEPPPWPPAENLYLEEATKYFVHKKHASSHMELGGKVPPFRGRCRVGRGGRIIIDRRSRPRVTSGIVPYWETDVESNSRLDSLLVLYQSGSHPFATGFPDAEKLLKANEKLIAKLKTSYDPLSEMES